MTLPHWIVNFRVHSFSSGVFSASAPRPPGAVLPFSLQNEAFLMKGRLTFHDKRKKGICEKTSACPCEFACSTCAYREGSGGRDQPRLHVCRHALGGGERLFSLYFLFSLAAVARFFIYNTINIGVAKNRTSAKPSLSSTYTFTSIYLLILSVSIRCIARKPRS